ncbi:YtxH domain-containing protein [Petrachloros mirabilis]
MSERMDGVLMGGFMFLAGMAVGVGTGLLVAPESGARTRRRLREYAEDLGDQITDLADETKVKVGKFVDRGKDLVSTNHVST